jgi:hypothetical protein
MRDYEYAMVQTADGTQVRRPEAERSLEKFRRALAERGGSMPAGMHWNEKRGFYSPACLTLAEARARNLQVAREIEWEQLRLKLPPTLAAMAAKLDQSMR